MRISILSTIVALFALANALEKPLDIQVTAPVECERKTKSGDKVDVQYFEPLFTITYESADVNLTVTVVPSKRTERSLMLRTTAANLYPSPLAKVLSSRDGMRVCWICALESGGH